MTLIIKQSTTSTVLRIARRGDEVALELEYTPEVVILAPSGTTGVTVGDANYDKSEPTLYYMGGRVVATNTATFATVTDLTPGIATTDDDGNITRVAEGTARFGYTESGVTKSIDVDLNNKTDGATVVEFTSVVVGSLSEHLSNEVDSRINSGMTLAANGGLFTTQDHDTPSYVRNVNFWGSDIDLTCISPWNSNAGNFKAGTLLTPRHLLGAAHYEFGVGTVVRFVAMDNTVVSRTVTGKKRHPDFNGLSPDFTIYTLDSDVPASITHCKVMPSDVYDYMIYSRYVEGVWYSNMYFARPAGFGLDQEEKGLIADLYKSGGNAGFQNPVDSDRLLLHEPLVLFDSGNPGFIILNGELVCTTVWSGPWGGTAISGQIADLNQMIIDADTQAGVSTGYTVTEADFSAFPTYA